MGDAGFELAAFPECRRQQSKKNSRI